MEKGPISISSDDLISSKSVRLGHDEEGHVQSVSSAVHSVDHEQQRYGQLAGSACMAHGKFSDVIRMVSPSPGAVAEGLFLLPFVRPMGKMLDWRSVASSPSRWGVGVE